MATHVARAPLSWWHSQRLCKYKVRKENPWTLLPPFCLWQTTVCSRTCYNKVLRNFSTMATKWIPWNKDALDNNPSQTSEKILIMWLTTEGITTNTEDGKTMAQQNTLSPTKSLHWWSQHPGLCDMAPHFLEQKQACRQLPSQCSDHSTAMFQTGWNGEDIAMEHARHCRSKPVWNNKAPLKHQVRNPKKYCTLAMSTQCVACHGQLAVVALSLL